MTTSGFNVDLINKALAGYSNIKEASLPLSVKDYEDFCRQIPILIEDRYRTNFEYFLENNYFQNCSFSMSSASSGKPKLIAQRFWPKQGTESYPYQLIKQLRHMKVFETEDTVANLFSAAGMSTLYEGCNRFLASCGTNILPIGRLDHYQGNPKELLQLMQKLSVNTLIGTPSSILQCAHTCATENISLNIHKIVFTGEMFNEKKKAYAKSVFPQANFFGLYGHSEIGFVGISTPHCGNNNYHLFHEHFFIEVSKNQQILITDLTKPVLPLFRYAVGDQGEILKTCRCGESGPVLHLKGRIDKKFNYMGNLLSHEKIQTAITNVYGKIKEVQIQLKTDEHGKDELCIVIDEPFAQLETQQKNLMTAIANLEEVNEGLLKGTGKVRLLSQEHFFISHRQKQPLIYDER